MLAFAKLLRARGHDVVFTGASVEKAKVNASGFELIVLGEHLPGETLAEEQKAKEAEWRARPPASARESFARSVEKTRLFRREMEHRQAMFQYLLDNAASFARYEWDLFISDFDHPISPLFAFKAGLRNVLLSTGLYDLDRRAPPIESALALDGSFGSLARTWFAWKKKDAARWLGTATPRGFFVAAGARKAPREFGVPPLRMRSAPDMQLDLPTLVAYPEAFDFEHERPNNVFHIEPLVDMDRKEQALPAGLDRLRRRVVYASVGTQAWRLRDPARFFQMLVDALGDEPDVELVLNVGEYFEPSKLRLEPNVTVVRWAPQLAVLARASLAITHGGLNSVKESILSGVPMVVFPMEYDQSGNAARVTHHGLGLSRDPRRARAEETRAACREVMDNPTYALRVGRMRDAFGRAQASGAGAAIVEQVLAAGRPRAVVPVSLVAAADAPV